MKNKKQNIYADMKNSLLGFETAIATDKEDRKMVIPIDVVRYDIIYYLKESK